MNNLITGVPGLRVGHAHDERLGSGVTALIFEAPAIASIAVHGGAPGLRDAALLEPGMTVERVDALVLSGGSVYGLDSMAELRPFSARAAAAMPCATSKCRSCPARSFSIS